MLAMNYEMGISVILYSFLGYITIMGGIQWYQYKFGELTKVKSYVPLGAVALIVGVIGNVVRVRQAFDAIAAAGDVSPELVASEITRGYDFLIIGLVTLAVAFLYKYITQ